MSLFLDKPALLDWPINPFDWDKDFYKFMRYEKDMHPYSVIKNKDGSITIVHNVLGLDKKEQIQLYDLVCDCHKTKKIPADIEEFIIGNDEAKEKIRKIIYENNSGEVN